MNDAPARLESLDVFRGLTIAAMSLVSTPGTWSAVYAPLDHAAWNGWTPTDLVFPFLLVAMGAAVPFALARLTERVPLRGQIALAISALGGYWAAMMLVRVPGVGAGVLTPAGNLAS